MTSAERKAAIEKLERHGVGAPLTRIDVPNYRVTELHPAVYAAPDVASAFALRQKVEECDAKEFYQDHSHFIQVKEVGPVARAAIAESEMQEMLLQLTHSKTLSEKQASFLLGAITKTFEQAAGHFLSASDREALRIACGFNPPDLDGGDGGDDGGGDDDGEIEDKSPADQVAALPLKVLKIAA